MTYIRYWQAEGESLKTSARCKDAARENVLRGAWSGGTVPFGYRQVSRGTLNYKGRPIFDVEIDPEESETVKMIFKLYGKENYGSRMLAKELNDKGLLRRSGILWSSSLITRILRCTLYAGYFVLNYRKDVPEENKVRSPDLPHLQIVSKEDWEEVQKKIVKNRIHTRPPTRFGQLLLTGFTYCGQCGEKVTSMIRSKHKKIGSNEIDERKHKYRCRRIYTPQTARPDCITPSWRTGCIDDLVIQDAKEFLLTSDKEALANSHETEARIRLEEATKRVDRATQDVVKLEREVAKIKEEVVKALLGDSAFAENTLSEMLKNKERDLLEARQLLENAQNEIFDIDTELTMQATLKEEAAGWVARFDEASVGDKKSMLIKIIERVTLHSDMVEIKYKVNLNAPQALHTLTQQNAEDAQISPEMPHFFTQSVQKGNNGQRWLSTLFSAL